MISDNQIMWFSSWVGWGTIICALLGWITGDSYSHWIPIISLAAGAVMATILRSCNG